MNYSERDDYWKKVPKLPPPLLQWTSIISPSDEVVHLVSRSAKYSYWIITRAYIADVYDAHGRVRSFVDSSINLIKFRCQKFEDFKNKNL